MPSLLYLRLFFDRPVLWRKGGGRNHCFAAVVCVKTFTQ